MNRSRQLSRPVVECAWSLLLLLTAIGVASGQEQGAKPSNVGTLEEITIEGEIPEPQVLFITVREPDRFEDGWTKLYLEQISPTAVTNSGPQWIWWYRAVPRMPISMESAASASSSQPGRARSETRTQSPTKETQR